MKRLGWFILAVALMVGGLTVVNRPTPSPQPPQKQEQVQPPPPQKVDPPPPPVPKTPTISVPTPNYLPYNQIITQLDQWAKEAPGLTERGSYGRTSKGQPIHYIRVGNLLDKATPKKVVMIHGCIHGNEPLATGTVMAWIGNALSQYGKDKDITDLLNTRDIYFIPVLSPDSYPNSRYVDGVDPNRNFPCPARPVKSVPPIQSAMDFFQKIKPSAVISAHTWGRACLIPWGDSMTNCPDYDSYKTLYNNMKTAQGFGYRFMRACDMYGESGLNNPPPQENEWVGWQHGMPIYGGELDWYYRNGAMSMVMEMGTHQRIPSASDISTELNMTFRAMLLFVKQAPDVQLKQR